MRAYEHEGYRVEIEMYPIARALYMVENGFVDGFFPTYDSETGKKKFIYSDTFPGDNLGLLKRKAFQPEQVFKKGGSIEDYFPLIPQKLLGMVKNTRLTEDLKLTNFEPAFSDIQNIDKLAAGRVDYIVIDKLTAANLLINQRPHYIGLLEFVSPPKDPYPFHVAISRFGVNGRQKLDAFNRGLAALKKENTLQKILEDHGLAERREVPPNKTRLTIATVNNRDMLIMKELSEVYLKQHPDVLLDWKVLEESTLRTRLLSDLAIDDGQFDIMTIGAYEASTWAKANWITPFNHLPASYDVDDMIPTVRDSLQKDGELYALPFYAESSMLYYRRDIFAKNNLIIPEKPTYLDVRRFAEKLHAPEKGLYGICLRDKPGWGESIALIGTMINAYGGRWFNEKWEPEIDVLAWKEALKMYIDLVRNFGPPATLNRGYNENLQLFAQGHCAMWIDATIAAGALLDKNFSSVADKVGFTSAPSAVTEKGSQWMWSWSLAVPASSQHKAEAQEFIQWVTSKDYIREVGKRKGWLNAPAGTRMSTYKSAEYQAAAPFANFVLQSIIKADTKDSTLKQKPYIGIQLVAIPEFPAIGRFVSQKIAEVVRGDITLEQALSLCQTQVELQMKKSDYH